MMSTGGHTYRVGREYFVDNAALQLLARRVVVEPMLGGYQMLLADAVVRLTPVTHAPLPEQTGLLYRCARADGRDVGPTLHFLAGAPSGEWDAWPRNVALQTGCGCHANATASASPAPPCACKSKPAVVAGEGVVVDEARAFGRRQGRLWQLDYNLFVDEHFIKSIDVFRNRDYADLNPTSPWFIFRFKAPWDPVKAVQSNDGNREYAAMRARQRMPSVPRHYVELRVVRAEEEGPFPGQRGPLYQVGDGEGVNFLTGLWFAGVLDFVPGLRRGGVLEFFPT